MAENVSLSSAVRANLLSLQTTTELIARTQGRLSTGLRVASAVDDPVSFFQAKSLNDRSDDFTVKKRGIDQGISTITAASDAVTAIESLVQQLKGLILTAKSATTTTEVSNLVTQFNDLRAQINNLSSDATYQGLNLVNGTGQTLTVNFSNDTASVLSVGSYDLTNGITGLNINKLSATTSTLADLDLSATTNITFQGTADIAAFTLSAASAGQITPAQFDTVDLTVTNANGYTGSYAVSVGASLSVTIGTATLTINVYSSLTGAAPTGTNQANITAGTYAVGTAITFYVVTGATLSATGSYALTEIFTSAGGGSILRISGTSVSYSAYTGVQAVKVVGVGFTTEFNSRINNLDAALTTLRSRSQTLGSNVALLQTRLNFTKAYATTLSTGAGKLTLADLNEEGANLLALQTRQQLGIQSLAFAGQAEQTILTLFR